MSLISKGYTSSENCDVAKIVEKHTSLVKKISFKIFAKLPSSVQLDDVIQTGMIGLLEAAQSYSSTKGASFETFASMRIRGAILDDLRKANWTPRSVQKNQKIIAKAIDELEKKLSRSVKDIEVADFLEISMTEYQAMLADVARSQVFNFEDFGVPEDVLFYVSDDDKMPKPHTDVRRLEFMNDLIDKIDLLPEKEKLVLSLYYVEELNLKEIGDILGVSESRVSQIHSQAIVRLKNKLQEWF